MEKFSKDIKELNRLKEKIINSEIVSWFVGEGYTIEVEDNLESLTLEYFRDGMLVKIVVYNNMLYSFNVYVEDECTEEYTVKADFLINYILHQTIGTLLITLNKLGFFRFEENVWK